MLLSHCPIPVGNKIFVHPITIGEIRDVGESQYNRYLSILCKDKEDFQFENDDDLSLLDLNYIYCLYSDEYRGIYLEALSFFLKEQIHLHPDGFFYLGDLPEGRFITSSVYEELLQVLKKQNLVPDKKDKDRQFKPDNDKAKELIEKMKQIKEKIKKKDVGEELNLYDIVSIVSVHSANYGFFNVWDLTIYQLYTIFIRLMKKDDYDSKFSLMLQGAQIELSELKHWATRLDIN